MASSDEYGNLVLKSMIYTDYFLKGTQPTTQCPLHVSAYVDAIAASSDSPGTHQPPSFPTSGDRASLPLPTAQGTTGITPSSPASAPVTGGKVEPAPEQQPKKRGFWSRLFGKGDKDDQKKEDAKKEDEKAQGGKTGFGLAGIGGKQAQNNQQGASAGARGGLPDRDAKGGPNKSALGVKVTSAEIEAFKKGIAS